MKSGGGKVLFSSKKYRAVKGICLILALTICAVYISGASPRGISLQTGADGKSYIKWVDFGITEAALSDAVRLGIKSHSDGHSFGMTELLAYLGARYGGDFSRYKKADMESAYSSLSENAACFDSMKYYSYYKEAYGAVLSGWLGKYSFYEKKDGGYTYTEKYGLKVFSPIASGFSYSDYDDFGAARSFGYRRRHLGHDMLGSIGTPIIAVESGYVEAVGWNRYGGWRIGIRSFDGKRYYYYAHLRRNHPYADMYEGKIVTAGDVIGYLGMTGYSSEENKNNINVPHLHIGLQLIFDTSQKDGTNQIWIDMYEITKFLSKYRSKVYYDKEKGEYLPVNPMTDFSLPD